LDPRTEQALILRLVVLESHQSQAASASELLLADQLSAAFLLEAHDLLPTFLDSLLNLFVLVLLSDQLEFL
jgi:hypothetical protein